MTDEGKLIYDSDEEEWFSWWVQELVNIGVIVSHQYHPSSFPLTTKHVIPYTKRTQMKTKLKEETKDMIVLNPMVYTPDWRIKFSPMFMLKGFASGLIADIGTKTVIGNEPLIVTTNGWWTVDVKGVATKYDDGRYFTAMQKITYDKHGIYVQRLELSNKLSSIFERTFTPRLFLKTPTKKVRTLKYTPISAETWVGLI